MWVKSQSDLEISMSYPFFKTDKNLDIFELKQLVVFSFQVYQQYQHMSSKQSSWRDQVTLLSLLPLHILNNHSVKWVIKTCHIEWHIGMTHTYDSPKSKNIFAFVTNLTDFESLNVKHDRDMSEQYETNQSCENGCYNLTLVWIRFKIWLMDHDSWYLPV